MRFKMDENGRTEKVRQRDLMTELRVERFKKVTRLVLQLGDSGRFFLSHRNTCKLHC